MKAKIYQINIDRDVNGVCFMDFGSLEKFTGSPLVDMSIYDMVYEADFQTHTLDGIYRILNCEHPEDDLIETQIPTEELRIYFCDSFEFIYIQDARKTQLLSAALDWIWEHTESVDNDEFERVLKEHLGMTEEEISEYV